jgi:hypothetical protein
MYYGDIWESNGKIVLEILFFYDRWKTPNRAHVTIYEDKIDSISCYAYHSFRKMNIEQTEDIHKQEVLVLAEQIIQAAQMFQLLKDTSFSDIDELNFKETTNLVFIDFKIPTSPFTFTFLLRKFNEEIVIKIHSFECFSQEKLIRSFFSHSKHRIRLLPYLEKMLV